MSFRANRNSVSSVASSTAEQHNHHHSHHNTSQSFSSTIAPPLPLPPPATATALSSSSPPPIPKSAVKEILELAYQGDFSALHKALDAWPAFNIQTQDNSGNTLLHYAARWNHVNEVNWLLELGADPYIKNHKGKLPIQLSSDEMIKSILKECPVPNTQGMIIGKDVKIQGELHKWTNYASGYKKRWFVLEHGTLFYYRSHSEYPAACRGSIDMTHAKIVTYSNENKIDVIGLDSSIKYHLKADNASDAKRWAVALEQASIDNVGICKNESNGTTHSPESTEELVNYSDFYSVALLNLQDMIEKYEIQYSNIGDIVLSLSDGAAKDIISQYQSSTAMLKDSMKETLKICNERERFWTYKLDKQAKERRIFEESLRYLATENVEMELLHNPEEKKLMEPVSEKEQEEAEEFFDAIEAIPSSPALPLPSTAAPTSTLIVSSLVGYPSLPRVKIPSKSTDMKSVNLWSIPKNAIGKDLTKMPLPVNFNEPLSMLQRMCEDMEYADLLNAAAAEPDEFKRIQYLAAFAMSGYSTTDGRTSKPFNPLLGETFEYVSAVNGYRYVSEQVSHHPPISACYCENESYIYWSEVNVKTKFWGKSLEILPAGVSHYLHKETNEHYSWKKVTTAVNNIIIGKLWIDHYGEMKIVNHKTGTICSLNFKATGWRASDPRRVEGVVKSKDGAVLYNLSGYWDKYLMSRPAYGGEENVLWKRTPPPPHAWCMYNFTAFATALNEINEEMRKLLPPTDSRMRPDQRAMENGQFDEANSLKSQLEEHQRRTRKENERAGIIHLPKWFSRDVDEDSGEDHWVFGGGYWEMRANGQFEPSNIMNIDDVNSKEERKIKASASFTADND